MSEENSDLFGKAGVPAAGDGRAANGGVRGGGRPAGALNRVNRELREYLGALTGKDAIVGHYRVVSAIDDPAELERLAREWGCDKIKVVEIIAKLAGPVFDRVYPRLGSIEVRPAGAPEPGALPLYDFDGEAVEIGDLAHAAPGDLPDDSGEAA